MGLCTQLFCQLASRCLSLGLTKSNVEEHRLKAHTHFIDWQTGVGRRMPSTDWMGQPLSNMFNKSRQLTI